MRNIVVQTFQPALGVTRLFAIGTEAAVFAAYLPTLRRLVRPVCVQQGIPKFASGTREFQAIQLSPFSL
jgi:hypothetical protein